MTTACLSFNPLETPSNSLFQMRKQRFDSSTSPVLRPSSPHPQQHRPSLHQTQSLPNNNHQQQPTFKNFSNVEASSQKPVGGDSAASYGDINDSNMEGEDLLSDIDYGALRVFPALFLLFIVIFWTTFALTPINY